MTSVLAQVLRLVAAVSICINLHDQANITVSARVVQEPPSTDLQQPISREGLLKVDVDLVVPRYCHGPEGPSGNRTPKGRISYF